MGRTLYVTNYFLMRSCIRYGMFEGDVICGVIIHRDMYDLVTIKSPHTRLLIDSSCNYMASGRTMFLNIIECKENGQIKTLQKNTEFLKGAQLIGRH